MSQTNTSNATTPATTLTIGQRLKTAEAQVQHLKRELAASQAEVARLTADQIETAQQLIARGILSPNALQGGPASPPLLSRAAAVPAVPPAKSSEPAATTPAAAHAHWKTLKGGDKTAYFRQHEKTLLQYQGAAAGS